MQDYTYLPACRPAGRQANIYSFYCSQLTMVVSLVQFNFNNGIKGYWFLG
jgi:hypothetical protein